MHPQPREAEFVREQLLGSNQSEEPVGRPLLAPCQLAQPELARAPSWPPAGPVMNIDGTSFMSSLRTGFLPRARQQFRNASGFVECQDSRQRQMDSPSNLCGPSRAQRSPGRFSHPTFAWGKLSIPSPSAWAFYQSNALSTFSTWTSGRTFKQFLFAEIFTSVAGLSLGTWTSAADADTGRARKGCSGSRDCQALSPQEQLSPG